MTNFNQDIPRKNTFSTKFDFTHLKFNKKDLIPFWISDMDFKAPDEILELLHQRVNHGIFGYSKWENEDYLNAITSWYKKRFNLDINPSWITYSTGVIFCISNLVRITNPDKKPILITTPAFDGFFSCFNNDNYEVITSKQKQVGINEFVIDFEDFEKKCQKAKIFILCNPNNPNGKLWSKEELKNCVEICKKNDCFIISDDVYMDLVFKKQGFIPIFEIAKELDYLEKTIIVAASGKTFNTPSLGGAFALIPNSKIHSEFVKFNTMVNNLNSPLIFSMISLIEGYNHCEYWIEDIKQYFLSNFKIIEEFIAENLPDIKFKTPEATYFAWLDLTNLPYSQAEIQDKLINKGNLAIMPSHYYGIDESFLRFNIACSENFLKKGLEHLKNSLL